MSSRVGLGDLLRAWDATGREPAAIASLARMLDLGEPEQGRAAAAAPGAVAAAAAPALARPAGGAARAVVDDFIDRSPVDAGAATGVLAPGEPDLPAALHVTELPAVAPDLPAWWTREELAPPSASPRVPPASLFAPQRERALLAAATRILRPDGEIDTDQLIQGFALQSPPRDLPRLRVPSLAGGCQLILDGSPWMAPFSDDLAALATRLGSVAGGAFDELSVPTLPPDVQRLDDLDPAPWRPPPAGTAIIVVSDLGRAARRRGDPGPGARWEAFLRAISVADFAPIVIVPGRCAAEVCTLRNAKVIEWDRETRVAEVARLRKERWR